MTSLFKKLKRKEQTNLLVLNAPPSFAPELGQLRGRRVLRATR
jgi:hypothetical protein